MKTVRMKLDPVAPTSPSAGRIDAARVDATTDKDIAGQQATDEREARLDAAKFARRVRKRLGLSQAAFAELVSGPTTSSAEPVERERN